MGLGDSPHQVCSPPQLDWDRLHLTRRATTWVHHPSLSAGGFPAATVVRVLDERDDGLARVTDGVLTAWVHVGDLEPVPDRPRTALERVLGKDEL